MPRPTELLQSLADPIEQKPVVRGYVSTNRPAPVGFPKANSTENLLYVIVPSYSTIRPLGPCNWGAEHGSTLPKQGDAVVVTFDEQNIPTVVWWQGETVEGGTTYFAGEGLTLKDESGKETFAVKPATTPTPSGAENTVVVGTEGVARKVTAVVTTKSGTNAYVVKHNLETKAIHVLAQTSKTSEPWEGQTGFTFQATSLSEVTLKFTPGAGEVFFFTIVG